MYEELYIIDKGVRLKVDLAIPSGITLNFKSNIFGDLSKITCSYSYTFKLPLTANNRRALDNADDIRTTSNKIRKRLKAVYIQNGIPLFENANLYIDSTETCFNAIMTWGVIDGLQTLKDDDISLQELNYRKIVSFGKTDAKITEYRNDIDVVKPIYNAGAPYVDEYGNKGHGNLGYYNGEVINLFNAFPPPAVPIYWLVQKINEQFGTKFIFGSTYQYGDTSSDNELIKMGVVPLVNALATSSMNTENIYTAPLQVSTFTWCGKRNLLKIISGSAAPTNELYGFNSGIGIKINSTSTRSFEFDGKVFAIFKFKNDYKAPVDGQMSYYHYLTGSSGYKPCLKVYVTTNNNSASEVASLEGKYNFASGWMFDFTKEDGYNRISANIPAGATVFFGFHAGDECEQKEFQVVRMTNPNDPYDNETTWSNVIKSIDFYPVNSSDSVIDVFADNETEAGSVEIDLISNLPDISVMTFMKSLYFMMGAFPTINPNGDIVALYYSDLKKAILNQTTLDWSNKITTDYHSLPTKISYAVSGYARMNYFLTKSDSLGKSDNNGDDVFESGIGVINVNNDTLEKSKTIIQLPYNAPYKKNLLAPQIMVGNTFKFWDVKVEDNKIEMKEAKPIIGIVKPFPKISNGSETGIVWMGMRAWNGFANIGSDSSYLYLSRIMENPIIITENLLLDEHDLRHLDYSIPVYISKYGAYFAIVSITRDSKGICKCELLKLPEEE